VTHVDLLRYSESAHHPFVFATFSDSLRSSTDWNSRRQLEHALHRALLDPESSTAVATPKGRPDELLGWAVSLRGALFYAYVRFPYRMSKIVRHVGDGLIREVCGQAPGVRAALWTLDASRMAAHGYPIRYDLDAHNEFKQLAR